MSCREAKRADNSAGRLYCIVWWRTRRYFRSRQSPLTTIGDRDEGLSPSDALAMGYLLYGSPAATFNGVNVIVAQALVWPSVHDSIAESSTATATHCGGQKGPSGG